MEKYELIPEQLLYEGTVTNDNFFHPPELAESSILLTHEEIYWNKLKSLTLSQNEIREIGFPMSERLVQRGRHIANGTIMCGQYAQQFGVSLNVAGGTHHSFSYKGAGFCLLNDIAIAANYMLHYQLAKKILIVDLDVHQGDGTAQIFAKQPRVFTFSMHGQKNYPLRKERSDLDIGLPDKTSDAKYLRILREELPRLIDKLAPDLLFYLAGVDVLTTDKLGRLNMSIAGCKERDRIVLELCKKNNIPVAVSMGGGYSNQLSQIIEAHANTFRLAQEIFF